jgi:hypothetical protein
LSIKRQSVLFDIKQYSNYWNKKKDQAIIEDEMLLLGAGNY